MNSSLFFTLTPNEIQRQYPGTLGFSYLEVWFLSTWASHSQVGGGLQEFLWWLRGLRTHHSVHADVGLIPGLAWWVKDPALPQMVVHVSDVAWIQDCHGCSIGLRCSFNSTHTLFSIKKKKCPRRADPGRHAGSCWNILQNYCCGLPFSHRRCLAPHFLTNLRCPAPHFLTGLWLQARNSNPFFLSLAQTPWLDNQYCPFCSVGPSPATFPIEVLTGSSPLTWLCFG